MPEEQTILGLQVASSFDLPNPRPLLRGDGGSGWKTHDNGMVCLHECGRIEEFRSHLVLHHIDSTTRILGQTELSQPATVSTGTGNSGAPHLHIEPRYGSSNRCAQPYLRAVYDGRTPPAVRNLPTTGCTS